MSEQTSGGTTPAGGSSGSREHGRPPRLAAPKWLFLFRKVNNFQWVLAEVEVTRLLIERLAARAAPNTTMAWRDTAEQLLADTEASVAARERQRAWLTLKAAQRVCVHGMGEAERYASAIELDNEAEKIGTEWRVKAIREILDLRDKAPSDDDLQRLFDPDLKDNPADLIHTWSDLGKIWRDGLTRKSVDPDKLEAALAIRDEHFDNLWRKVERRQNAIVTSMVCLGTVIFLIVMLWQLWACLTWFNVVIEAQQISLVVVALFGALGASLSTAYSLVSADLPNKYTEGAMTIAVTAARPLIGAAAAVAILFIYAGGLMDNLLTAKMYKATVLYAVAFTSGFSERLIFSATRRIADRAAGS